MEDGDLNRAQIGPSLQVNTPPLEKLKQITVYDMDDMKRMPMVFAIGYHYLPSSVQPVIHRLQPILMFHFPFPGPFCCQTGAARTLTGRTAVFAGRIETDSLASGD